MKTTHRHLIASLALGFALCGPGAWAQNEAPRGPGPDSGPGRPGGPGPGGPRWFAQVDADGDGVLSESELGNAATALRKLDANADGKVSLDEMRGAGARRGGPGSRDGDGERRRERVESDGNGERRGPDHAVAGAEPRRGESDVELPRRQGPGPRWGVREGGEGGEARGGGRGRGPGMAARHGDAGAGPQGPFWRSEAPRPLRRALAARAWRGMGPGRADGPGRTFERQGRGAAVCPCCQEPRSGRDLDRGPGLERRREDGRGRGGAPREQRREHRGERGEDGRGR